MHAKASLCVAQKMYQVVMPSLAHLSGFNDQLKRKIQTILNLYLNLCPRCALQHLQSVLELENSIDCQVIAALASCIFCFPVQVKFLQSFILSYLYPNFHGAIVPPSRRLTQGYMEDHEAS